MDTGSSQGTEGGSAHDGAELSEREARLLTDLRRITEATTRLEYILVEAHNATLRAYAAGRGAAALGILADLADDTVV